MADKQEVRRAVSEVVQTFGRIDILVNNAGIFELGSVVGADYDRAADSYERQFGVNARGTFLCTLAVVPMMLKQGGGASSTSSRTTSTVNATRPRQESTFTTPASGRNGA